MITDKDEHVLKLYALKILVNIVSWLNLYYQMEISQSEKKEERKEVEDENDTTAMDSVISVAKDIVIEKYGMNH